MTQPFIGQIQPYAFNFAPKNWALCNGQIMSIAQNTALFSLLGTMYGGNGQTTFALPDLQSRAPLHVGTLAGETYTQGEEAGAEQVTLDISTMPAHTHAFLGSPNDAGLGAPVDGAALATVHQNSGNPANPYYAPDTTPQPLDPGSVLPAGSNLPHNNLQPYLTINWCICLYGIYPSRN